jgi:hypothetical protein
MHRVKVPNLAAGNKLKLSFFCPKQFSLDPNFFPQIVADVETRRYSPFLGPGNICFGKVMRETRRQKFYHTIRHTNLDFKFSIFAWEKLSVSNEQYIFW